MTNTNSTPNANYIPPSKELDWWSEDAIVRFGTNIQKSTEPAWQDVGANVLRMDSLYDATFHRWLKSEENVLTIAIHLQRIANEYPLDRTINALRWLVSSWRVESTAVIVRYVTADWATPQNPPQPSASPFRSDISRHASLLTDPGVLAGESRRGVLVRELTKDWTSQQIAQLVSILAVNLWCERPHLEAFIRSLVCDWDFCRLSSFFSYITNQLCLDYRVKVTMLQQAARRNASRLSLKRPRNSPKSSDTTTVAASDGADVKVSAAADAGNANSDDGDGDSTADGSNKRLRTEASLDESSSSVSASVSDHDNDQAMSVAIEPTCAAPASSTVSGATAADLPLAARPSTHLSTFSSTSSSTSPSSSTSSSLSAANVSSCAATVSTSSSGAAGQILGATAPIPPSSSSSSGNTTFDNATPHAAAGSSHASSCMPNSGAPVSLSVRASQAGRMPLPLTHLPATTRSSSVMATAATAAASTMPSTPVAVTSSSSSQPSGPPPSSAGSSRTSELLQTSSSTTDLTSIPFNTPPHSAVVVQGSRQLQHHRHQLGQPGSATAVVGGGRRRTRSRNNTGSAVTDASSSATSPLAPPQTSLCTDRSASSSSSSSSALLLPRRPLTPQIVNGLFIVHPDGYRHQSPDSPTLRIDHHGNSRYGGLGRGFRPHPQPLAPSRSSTTLSMDGGMISDRTTAESAADASVVESHGVLGSVGGVTNAPRQAMRYHAASVSVGSTTTTIAAATAASGDSQGLLSGNGGGRLQTQQQAELPDQHYCQTQQEQQQQQQQDFRGRTASESELGQFDGPASTHLASLPIPSDSSAGGAPTAGSVCGRPSTAAHYDVLGIVMESAEQQHHLTESSV